MRLLILFVLSLAAAAGAAQSNANWDYAGKHAPIVWGKLDPAYSACSKGHEQAPIDIHGAHLNKALQPLEFHFIAGPATLENDGRRIVVHVTPGSTMTAGGERYELQSFDFHHPSEQSVRGKLTEMDVHLLYKSTDGKMAVVVVRLIMDRGTPNAVVATLWPHLPRTTGATAKVPDMVNAGGFVPADPGYWTYMGSLSTPPCTEGVRWFVFENELSVSLDQLRAYTAIFRIDSRPVQDGHGRRIEANE